MFGQQKVLPAILLPTSWLSLIFLAVPPYPPLLYAAQGELLKVPSAEAHEIVFATAAHRIGNFVVVVAAAVAAVVEVVAAVVVVVTQFFENICN